MSRCFPYPPPGYVCNSATGDALIESIKIEKEKEKVKREKKELKRREKEQKKKEKKEKKEKERHNSSIPITDGTGSHHKRKRDCDGFEKSVENSKLANSKHVYLQKEIEPVAEQLERSSLTEEHGQPIVAESLCYSSDGTQGHSKKCKIEKSHSKGDSTTQGKVFRFRLKKREPGNTNPADDIPSTSGRIEYPPPKVVEGLPVKDTDNIIGRPNEQLTFNATPSVRQDSATILTNSSPTDKVSKPKSAYESLFSEWVPPIRFDSVVVNDDDENWLLPSKKRTLQDSAANLNAYEGLSGRQSMSFQPRAHMLPELNIYALPYTVPL